MIFPYRHLSVLFLASVFLLPQAARAATIYLTSGSSWDVPSDWNDNDNSIEVIGGGGGGAASTITGNYAGGGGAYSKSSNISLRAESAVTYSIGSGGSTGATGGDTYFNGSSCGSASVCAKGGGGGASVGGAGGSASAGIGTTRYSGGAGSIATRNQCGSAGGAAGPHGDGNSSANCSGGGAGDAGYGGGGGAIGGYLYSGSPGGNGGEYGSYGSGGGGGAGTYSTTQGGNGGYYGGGGAANLTYNPSVAGLGAPGLIVITYSPRVLTPEERALLATCSVTLTPNPADYDYNGTATLTWTATRADRYVQIRNVAPLTGSGGTFTVPTRRTTDYSCIAYGTGGTDGWHPASLVVTPPPKPVAHITTDAAAIKLGDSAHIRATFAASGHDVLLEDNIDSPVRTGLGTSTNPDAVKKYLFTPDVVGSYVFYARARTGAYAWDTYDSVQVDVSKDLSCNPRYFCSNQTIKYLSAECNVSTIKACVAPTFCVNGLSECRYPPPGFNPEVGFTGHLQAIPSLLHENDKTSLHWNVSNVDASTCIVQGANGDEWKKLSASGSSGKSSSPIAQQTIYTLYCKGVDGSDLKDKVIVNILPEFIER